MTEPAPFLPLQSVTFLRTINVLHVPTNTSQQGKFTCALDEGLTFHSAGRPQPIAFRLDARGKVELDFGSVRMVDLPAVDLDLIV